MVLIALAVKLTSKGPVLYWSDRVGRWNRIFPDAKVPEHAKSMLPWLLRICSPILALT